MITIDELKVQLAEYGKSVQDIWRRRWPSTPAKSVCRSWSTP